VVQVRAGLVGGAVRGRRSVSARKSGLVSAVPLTWPPGRPFVRYGSFAGFLASWQIL